MPHCAGFSVVERAPPGVTQDLEVMSHASVGPGLILNASGEAELTRTKETAAQRQLRMLRDPAHSEPQDKP